MSIFKISDPDIWLHFYTGKYILENHTIPRKDIFTYTAYGREWIPHHWLSSVIFYSVYSKTGAKGLIILKYLLLSLTLLIVFLTAQKVLKADVYICALIFMLLILSFGPGYRTRAQIISFLLLSLLQLALFSYEKSKIPFKKIALLIFLIFTLWSNFHLGFLYGLSLIGIFLMTNLLKRNFKRCLNHLCFLIIACTGILINPWGYKILIKPIQWLFAFKESRYVLSFISEYNPLFHLAHKGILPLNLFKTYLIFCIFSFFFNKRINLLHVFLFIFFVVLPIFAIRNIPIFLIISAPIVAYNFSARIKVKKKWAGFLIEGIILLLTVYTFKCGQIISGGVKRFVEFGIDERNLPKKAVDFLKKNEICGNIFNTYNIGEYLIWRGFKVFIDGRSDVCGKDIIENYLKVLYAKENFEKILEKYKIKCVLVDYVFGATNYPIHDYLWNSEKWNLCYFDDKFVIYIKDAPGIKRYKFFNPAITPLKQIVHDSIFIELKRKIKEDPDCYVPYSMLGRLYEMKTRIDSAIIMYRKVINVTKEDYIRAMHFTRLGFLYFVKGKYEMAEEMYKAAIRLKIQGYAEPYAKLGLLYEIKGEIKNAIKMYKKALRINPKVKGVYKRLQKLQK